MITLNVNGPNTQRLSERIKKKQAPTVWGLKPTLQETNFKYKDTYRLKVKGWRKIYHDTTNKKAGVAILILDRAHFRARKVIRDKEWHHLMIKRSVFQEDVTNP